MIPAGTHILATISSIFLCHHSIDTEMANGGRFCKLQRFFLQASSLSAQGSSAVADPIFMDFSSSLTRFSYFGMTPFTTAPLALAARDAITCPYITGATPVT